MEEPKQETTPQLRGLYSKVKISVRSLNIIIVVLVALLVACMAYGIAKGGFRVSFDTQGGTVVESQVRMHGELLEKMEPQQEKDLSSTAGIWTRGEQCRGIQIRIQ